MREKARDKVAERESEEANGECNVSLATPQKLQAEHELSVCHYLH